MEPTELSFGQKAVGLTFNPSNNPDVDYIKSQIALVIDRINDIKSSLDTIEGKASWTRNVLFTAAFNTLVAAQMAAVKYVTWKD